MFGHGKLNHDVRPALNRQDRRQQRTVGHIIRRADNSIRSVPTTLFFRLNGYGLNSMRRTVRIRQRRHNMIFLNMYDRQFNSRSSNIISRYISTTRTLSNFTSCTLNSNKITSITNCNIGVQINKQFS